MTDSPVLIVFCREPVAGQTKTRLIEKLGAKNAAALADAFIIDTMAKASALEPSKLVIAGTGGDAVQQNRYFRLLARRFGAQLMDQGQGSLGARMAHAIAPFCDKGALLIGTDLPSLPFAALRRLSDLLVRRKLVLGPSLDGGYYAIGVRGDLPPVFT